MDLFASDEEVAVLEAHIRKHPAELPALIALAWHVRQRNCQRAMQLVADCETRLQQLPDTDATAPGWRLRLLLIRSEVVWLQAQMEQALAQTQQVLEESRRQEDWTLEADAWWLRGWILHELGHLQERDQCWQRMQDLALARGDQRRAAQAEISVAVMAAYYIPFSCPPLPARYTDPDYLAAYPDLAAAVYDYLGARLRKGTECGQASAYWMQSFDAACKTGQLRRAIIVAGNIGTIFSRLNDQNTAMDWMERALNLARPTHWPGPIGTCLMHTSLCLRHLGRLDTALGMLQETLEAMQALRGSRNYAVALSLLGDLAIARQDYPLALDTFCRLQERADALAQSDVQTNSRRGQAQALVMLERYDQALHLAQEALLIAQQHQDVQNQVESLRILAKIYSRHHFPPPPDAQGQNPALYYLLRAQELADGIEGYVITPDLYDEIADAHAAAGDLGQAFSYSRQANQALHNKLLSTANNRALAIQMQHQTERARVEGEHLRQLATEQERRAQILHDTSSTLSHLSAIGQEITAQLDLDILFQVLRSHVRSLLDASYFAIFLCDADGRGLHSIMRQQESANEAEGSVRLPALHIDADDQYSFAAKCLREQKEILVSLAADQDSPARAKDARPTHSALFGPLTTGNRLLGVMTIQANRENAYGERECLIFRNLCAYGAIALHNANAYQQLRETQQQLVAKEKLAALGALVAGVAHELNTPLGNSLVVGSELQRLAEELEQKLQNKALNLSDLQTHILDTKDALGMLMRGLRSAANLVISFKQVAVDRTSEKWRPFDLQQTLQEILATLTNRVRAAGHCLSLEVKGQIVMHSYPGPLGQVLMNMVSNSLLHAYEGKTGGKLHLQARQSKPGRVEIIFSDDGCGISAQHLKHIFDPFFTTRLGQGGNGLGLSVSYNIITSVLGGKVTVHSTPGEGTSFILDLPQSVAASQGKAQDSTSA